MGGGTQDANRRSPGPDRPGNRVLCPACARRYGQAFAPRRSRGYLSMDSVAPPFPGAVALPAQPTSDLLAALRQLLPELRENWAVETLEVFGSRARGDAGPDSDLDLLVTFRQTPDLLALVALEQELSDRLGLRVDLVLRRALRPRARDGILRDVIPV